MRGQRNDNPACGTDAGYRAHGKNGTTRCDACKKAHAARRADYRKQAYLNRGSTLINGCGTRRRIQALAVIGYSLQDLADMLGCNHSLIAVWGKNGKPVTVATAVKVFGLYEKLSGTPGGNRQASSWARSRGWAGPLDWDEGQIDDPRAVPYCEIEAAHTEALREVKLRAKRAERAAYAARLRDDPERYAEHRDRRTAYKRDYRSRQSAA